MASTAPPILEPRMAGGSRAAQRDVYYAIDAAFMVAMFVAGARHTGLSHFRSDKLRKPVTGDLVWSVPTLATSTEGPRHRRRLPPRHRSGDAIVIARA